MENFNELNETIEKLNEKIEKQLSWKFIILKGVVYGLGTAIGATIIAGIAFSFLSSTLDTAEKLSVVEESQTK